MLGLCLDANLQWYIHFWKSPKAADRPSGKEYTSRMEPKLLTFYKFTLMAAGLNESPSLVPQRFTSP